MFILSFIFLIVCYLFRQLLVILASADHDTSRNIWLGKAIEGERQRLPAFELGGVFRNEAAPAVLLLETYVCVLPWRG